MGGCEIGMVTCLIEDPNIKYELLSFISVIMLPLALTIRMAINEHIFQRWKARFLDRYKAQQEQIDKMEVWLTILVSERKQMLREWERLKANNRKRNT